MSRRGVNVTALVDWRAQMHNCRLADETDANKQAKETLERTVRVLSRVLSGQSPDQRFRVSVRLYYGWTKGYQQQPSRRAIIETVAATDFSTLSRMPNVVIRPDVAYGDTILTALPIRMQAAHGIHLPGTLRERDRVGRNEEKMVDTALAADLLSLARTDPSDWAVVMAEDDDLVPALFTAEAWMSSASGRLLLLQNREPARRLVNLEGLLLKGNWT